MKNHASIAWALVFILLLTGSQCTETVTSTEVQSTRKVSADEGGFNGDLDADDRGAVWVLFMKTSGKEDEERVDFFD